MRIAYFDCVSGISGDMTLAAFVDGGLAPVVLTTLPQKLGLSQVRVEISRVERNGISATKVEVQCSEEHAHRHLHHIEKIIDGGEISPSAKAWAKRIFHRLAEAEAHVHNTTVEKVHFHEVGALDAIIDITGAAVAFDALGIETAYVGTIPVGGGIVQCAHGLMPVPGPATLRLLEKFSVRPGPVEKELVTPTGAAIVTTFVGEQSPLPPFKMLASGYGAGGRQFPEMPNVMRIVLGDTQPGYQLDTSLIIECNIDDMNPQLYPHVVETLLATGAHDAYLIPVIMKKGRPGLLLSVLCDPAQEAAILATIFRETTTIGVRKSRVERSKLQREIRQLTTAFGELQFKIITLPDGRQRGVPEFDDCRRVAAASGLPVREVYERALAEANNDSPRQPAP